MQQRTTEIKGLMRRAAQDIIEIGQKLIEVKARLGHGHFGDWLRAEFEWHQNTATNFMRVAEKFTNFVNVDQIAPSALYLLAAPSTPNSARDEALAQAEAGEPITYSAARELVNGHRAPAGGEPDEQRAARHVAEAAQPISLMPDSPRPQLRRPCRSSPRCRAHQHSSAQSTSGTRRCCGSP